MPGAIERVDELLTVNGAGLRRIEHLGRCRTGALMSAPPGFGSHLLAEARSRGKALAETG
ncbi:hypothetical protein [Mesorhizobium sp. YR577]|uniref:hypothetical protein n=1 Tax=Mesorhizobium sp. YR577 TaxID=1884373 RepID=UPI0008F174A7|nr:hypothetical protein [Mesorhizobium sp. YR577]SFU11034.1 hypothetical protein SAMN05518861_11366 [Mesorhizobium sp. YR577]